MDFHSKVLFVVAATVLQQIDCKSISSEGIALIKHFEGCRLTAYQDSVGVWTIGYGHTQGVQQGQTWTQGQAESALLQDLEEFEGYVDKYVKVPLTQYQFDALVSWTFNLGPTNLRRSTLLRKLNKRLYSQVPAEIKRWNRAGGRILPGLVRRRKAEALMFQGRNWRNSI